MRIGPDGVPADLSYDFDMVSIFPEPSPADRCVALWRDPAVAHALRGADERVRALFVRSGFGLTTHDSGAPPGTYPAYDEVARIKVLGSLMRRMFGEDLDDADWNGFNYRAFMESIETAVPWDGQILCDDGGPVSEALTQPDPVVRSDQRGAGALGRVAVMTGLAFALGVGCTVLALAPWQSAGPEMAQASVERDASAAHLIPRGGE